MDENSILVCIKPNDKTLLRLKSFGNKIPNGENYYTIRDLICNNNDSVITHVRLNEIINHEDYYATNNTGLILIECAFKIELFRVIDLEVNVNELFYSDVELVEI